MTTTYTHFLPWDQLPDRPAHAGLSPDDRSGAVYLDDPDLRLATEVAIVTQRPLLLQGEPGTGKSSFAPFVARNLGWRYYEHTVTGRTEARDLLWKYDALARLRDATAGVKEPGAINPARYITPGVLWWAFNRAGAADFLAQHHPVEATQVVTATPERPTGEPFEQLNTDRDPYRAVVLIDEIDKADPDVPNDLLEVLSVSRFTVDELGRSVERQRAPAGGGTGTPADAHGQLLLVLTTNQERDLPAAFIRRCIVHTLGEPRGEAEQTARLGRIARLHFEARPDYETAVAPLAQRVAAKCVALRHEARAAARRPPSTAEFLDALRACATLGIDPAGDLWKQIEQNVLLKETATGADW